MALKKIANLHDEGNDDEAKKLAELQLTNIKIAKKWGDSKMFANEEQTFLKVKRGLNKDVPKKVETKVASQNPDESNSNSLIKDGLGLAKQFVPGPWTLIISLFELML